jgi:hypothetical protein
MLTDIFANRYANRALWQAYTAAESRLLVQCYRNIAEQVLPYSKDGKVFDSQAEKWKSIHDQLSMELGLEELSPRGYWYETTYAGNKNQLYYSHTIEAVCKHFVTQQFDTGLDPDRFVKDRLSFVELAFRFRDEELSELTAQLPKRITEATAGELQRTNSLRKLGVIGRLDNVAARMKAANEAVNAQFQQYVAELNERFRQAGAPLNYHNGFIQLTGDELAEQKIERPFWKVVADPLWKNVDIDMKEALDRRDGNDRDPALYAAKALESAIKIISDAKGWTHGGEKGAHNYIDNLGAAKNGSFIESWERDALKAFFTSVRNPLGHGPGGEPMAQLTPQQTDWALETCMSWIKTLVARSGLGSPTPIA